MSTPLRTRQGKKIDKARGERGKRKVERSGATYGARNEKKVRCKILPAASDYVSASSQNQGKRGLAHSRSIGDALT